MSGLAIVRLYIQSLKILKATKGRNHLDGLPARSVSHKASLNACSSEKLPASTVARSLLRWHSPSCPGLKSFSL